LRDYYNNKRIYWYKYGKNGNIYKWGYPKNSLLSAIGLRSDVYFQIDEETILELVWVPYDEYKDKEHLKYFDSVEMSIEEFISQIHINTNYNYVSQSNFETTDEYFYYIEYSVFLKSTFYKDY
jgi:hypothetical protein